MAYLRPYHAGAYGPAGAAGVGAAAGPPPTITQAQAANMNPMMRGPMGANAAVPGASAALAGRQQAALGGAPTGAAIPPQTAMMQAQGGGMGMGMAPNPMLAGNGGAAGMGGGGTNMMSVPPGAMRGGAMGAYGMPSAASFGGASGEGPAEAQAEAVGEQEGAAEASAGRGLGIGGLGGGSLYLVAILLPPLAVISTTGSGELLLLNIVLTILGWLPGVFHAWYIISRETGPANARANM